MSTTSELLHAYDSQLRTHAEAIGATAVRRVGPLWLVTYAGGQGFVTYRDLDDADAPTIRAWVAQATDHFRADPAIVAVEWKTRGHDVAPGLRDALLAQGFVAEEPESIMVGAARLLDVEVELPEGVSLRRATTGADVRAMAALGVGAPAAEGLASSLLRRLEEQDGLELWVAEHEGQIVSAGRLEPVAGTTFAGIWGGATLPHWRRRGIYRALTAERARSALAGGKTLIHSDSTEFSRPILERSGFVKVSTTTPYEWRR